MAPLGALTQAWTAAEAGSRQIDRAEGDITVHPGPYRTPGGAHPRIG